MHLSDISSDPLYAQIVKQIRAQVLSGHLLAGSPILSIRDLAKTYRISVITVQKAYDELIRGGLLISRRGKGFYVAAIDKKDKISMAKERLKESLVTPLNAALAEGLSQKEIEDILMASLKSLNLKEHQT